MKTPDEEKTEIIQSFGKILDKHCSTPNEVYYVIRALRDWSEFMSNQRFEHNTNIMGECRTIESLIEKAGYKHHIPVFKNISESIIEGVILSGQTAEATNVINLMENDFSNILG